MAKKKPYKSFFVTDLTNEMTDSLKQSVIPDALLKEFAGHDEPFTGYDAFRFTECKTKSGGDKVKCWILFERFTEDQDCAYRYELAPDFKNKRLSVLRRRIARPDN